MSEEYGFGNPEVIEEEVDILIIGGGMAACGAAFEIGRWLEKVPDLKVKVVDKAALDRSGAVAQGLSAADLPPVSAWIFLEYAGGEPIYEASLDTDLGRSGSWTIVESSTST